MWRCSGPNLVFLGFHCGFAVKYSITPGFSLESRFKCVLCRGESIIALVGMWEFCKNPVMIDGHLDMMAMLHH